MSKTLSIILLSVWTLILGQFIYKTYFEKHFEAQSVLKEIETLKIDSIKSFEYSFDSTQTYYQFWVGGKYKIDVIDSKAKPFTRTGNQEVYIMNYDGKMVMQYNTKYQYVLFDAWESDYIRLMKYLNMQHR